ncbi:pyridoxine 5'-phosphate synthase [Calditrichota bacterium]
MRIGYFVDPVASLRDINMSSEPEPAIAASAAINAGAEVILAGWTRTGGHITDRDLKLISELSHSDLMLVASLGSEFVESVAKYRPHGVVMIGSGWDGKRDPAVVQLDIDSQQLTEAAVAYKAAGVQPLAFADPIPAQMKAAAKAGLRGVVLNAEEYANAKTDEDAEQALDHIADCAMAANKFGLLTAVYHGLNYQNIGPIASIRYVEEIYAGRSVTARALLSGLPQAIRDLIAILDRNRPSA